VGLLVSLLPLLAASTQASTSDGVVWHWDPDSAGCDLQQDVGDDRTVVAISRTPGNDQTVLKIKGSKPIRSAQREFQGGTIAFEPAGSTESEITVVEGYDGRREISAVSYDPDFMTKFGQSTEVDFTHQKVGQIKVAITAPKAAIDAIRICEDAKMREWGVDPVAWRSLAVKPKPLTPPDKWFSYLDYPDREKIYKNDITVVARLDLSADGSVQKCTVVNGPPAEFIPAVCNPLRRNAKLQPARDVSGKGTPAPYVVQVTFGAFLL